VCREVDDILLEPAIVASKKDELRTRQTSRKVAKRSFIFADCLRKCSGKKCNVLQHKEYVCEMME
jgi:hypothetical protein